MKITKLTFIFFFLLLSYSITNAQGNRNKLITRSWTFDIDAMLTEIPAEQKVVKKKLMQSMSIIYTFMENGLVEINIMGENIADGAFWQFSEDEKILYLTSAEGITEELEIIQLNQTHLTIKDIKKDKTTFFVPYTKK